MLNYMSSEFYRLVRNRGYWMMLAVCCAILAFTAFIVNDLGMTLFFNVITSCLAILLAFPITLMTSFASGEEKEQTIRHAVVFGIGRTKIYLARAIVHFAMCIFAYVFILAFAVIVSGAFCGFDQHVLDVNLPIYTAAIPLYLATAAMEYALLMWLPSNGTAQATGFGITWLLPFVLMNFGLKYPLVYKAYKLFPASILVDDLYTYTQTDLFEIAGLGILYTLVLMMIGNCLFSKREY